jgi:Fe-S oxidoreductase/nitrate reductase gamma subunit
VSPTREVFGNIAPWMRVVFYGAILASLGLTAWQVYRRARLWRRGEKRGPWDWRAGLKRLLVYALLQKRVHRRSLGGVLHLLLFSGFLMLTVGTTLLFIAHAGPVDFHHGWYYLFYELTLDAFGLAFCVGCVLALYRRAAARPAGLGHAGSDWYVLALLLALGLTGFAIEALRLHYTQVDAPIARWSFIGHGLDRLLLSGVSLEAARSMHLAVWWLHTALVVAFFVTLPMTRLFHVIAGPLHVAAKADRHAGALLPVSMEQVEQTGRVGVSAIEHFGRAQLLSLDACMECGRCSRACPALATGKPLDPKSVVVALREQMAAAGETAEPPSLHGRAVMAETLWACTMCQACVDECPVLIGHVDLISDLRRHLVSEGQISGSPADAMRKIASFGNPYGRPNAQRMEWAEGLDVPTVETDPDFEYLLWVGCAGAFDPRAQKVVRATAQLLRRAGVRFAVLGTKETCTGDSARRLGDEFLFQEKATAVIETLNAHRVRKIVTACPHCLNTIRNEYPQFGGHYEVEHHSRLLARLVESGRLAAARPADGPITLHDPCYLARVNGEVEAPRKLLNAAGSTGGLREMPRHGRQTSCCGAGGGRMWFEEPPAQRVSRQRAAEALGTGAKQLVTACPFCLNMLTDGMAGTPGGENVRVLDVAEVLSAQQDEAAPTGHNKPEKEPSAP